MCAAHLRKEFSQAGGQTVVALNDVNLEIQPGEFVSLIGPSGCGKSTFLRLLAGLETPNEGVLSLDDEVITGASYERGLVFQDPTLFPWLSIWDNITFGLKIRNVYSGKKKEVVALIKLVGLEGFEKSYPHQLSGGMAQRAALARALVNHPKVLLLDEPFGALDAFTRMNMQDELLRIWQERGTTMIMVTHDVDEAIYLSDRILVMSARPAQIKSVIDVQIGRPRARDLPDFLQMRAKILQILDYVGERADVQYYL
ncbi:MAG: ABC transporter ATP-binding protein [Peptococcaceae bacterium]|nr:ABC transporter ATP-binding protein [Peptococcaceae bacterium]